MLGGLITNYGTEDQPDYGLSGLGWLNGITNSLPSLPNLPGLPELPQIDDVIGGAVSDATDGLLEKIKEAIDHFFASMKGPLERAAFVVLAIILIAMALLWLSRTSAVENAVKAATA